MNPKGEISSVTTTSGLAWKIPGRVGDSPIVGASFYPSRYAAHDGREGALRDTAYVFAQAPS